MSFGSRQAEVAFCVCGRDGMDKKNGDTGLIRRVVECACVCMCWVVG